MSLRIHGDLDAKGARLDFAVNVQGTQPPQWLQDAITQQIPQLAHYPDQDQQCRNLLAQYHQVSPEEILITQGGAEGFSLLPWLNPAAVHIAQPGFQEPGYVFANTDIPTHDWNLPAPFTLEHAPQLPAPDVLAQSRSVTSDRWWEQQQMVIIGNPTNPTGVVHSNLEKLVQPGRLLVVDEAFMDLVLADATALGNHNVPGNYTASEQTGALGRLEMQGSEPLSMIGKHGHNVIVLRSLTKTWGIAGLRLGYMVAHPDIIARLSQLRAHWALGSLQAAAIEAIFSQGITQLPQLAQSVATRRQFMSQALEQAGFAMASSSQAPFLLTRPLGHRKQSAAELAAASENLRLQLKEQGIAIRRCDTFPGLDGSYWRLAVRPGNQVQQFLEAYQRLLESS